MNWRIGIWNEILIGMKISALLLLKGDREGRPYKDTIAFQMHP